MEYKTTSDFRQSLNDLLMVRRNVYSGVKEEIQKEFSGKTISQIRMNRDLILIEDDSIIIKLRLPDKKQRLSKKDGYRLIYYVSKTKDIVIFLKIYPKNGPLQKLNITPGELSVLLVHLIEEKTANSLLPFG